MYKLVVACARVGFAPTPQTTYWHPTAAQTINKWSIISVTTLTVETTFSQVFFDTIRLSHQIQLQLLYPLNLFKNQETLLPVQYGAVDSSYSIFSNRYTPPEPHERLNRELVVQHKATIARTAIAYIQLHCWLAT